MELSVLQDIFKYAKEKKCPLEKAPHKEKEANLKSVVRKEGTESILGEEEWTYIHDGPFFSAVSGHSPLSIGK